jgi:hypothetical protein
MPHTLFVGPALLTVVETSTFARRAEQLLTIEEYAELILFLALHPESGTVISGTGGLRKVRFAALGRGKSGGVRVIYYFFDNESPLYALMLYGKNEQADLSAEQKKHAAGLVARIKAAARARRIG